MARKHHYWLINLVIVDILMFLHYRYSKFMHYFCGFKILGSFFFAGCPANRRVDSGGKNPFPQGTQEGSTTRQVKLLML